MLTSVLVSAPTATIVPQGELAFIPGLPATVERVNSKVGSVLSGGDTIVTLALGNPDIVAELGTSSPTGFKTGLPAEVTMPDGEHLSASVSALTGFATANPSVTLRPHSRLGLSDLGSSVQVIITVQSTAGTVLAVPLSALRMAPDGSTAVMVIHGTAQALVEVSTGLTGDGYAALTKHPPEVNVGTEVAIQSSSA
jgi:hypothetical protein